MLALIKGRRKRRPLFRAYKTNPVQMVILKDQGQTDSCERAWKWSCRAVQMLTCLYLIFIFVIHGVLLEAVTFACNE